MQVEQQTHGPDAYWASYWDGDDLFYGHVLGFKGLERPAVVLAVNGFRDPDRASEMLYVGLSRARDLLVVCGDPDADPPGRRRRGRQAPGHRLSVAVRRGGWCLGRFSPPWLSLAGRRGVTSAEGRWTMTDFSHPCDDPAAVRALYVFGSDIDPSTCAGSVAFHNSGHGVQHVGQPAHVLPGVDISVVALDHADEHVAVGVA